MSRPVPVPHDLSFVTLNAAGERKTHGPFRYESKGEALRAKRAARETHGGEYCCGFVDRTEVKPS